MITEKDMERVRELLSWAAKEIPKMAGVDFDTLPEEYKERNRVVARSILSHPDLVLIDRDRKELPQLVYITEDNRDNELECARHAQMDMINSGYNHRLLPLAEALREILK